MHYLNQVFFLVLLITLISSKKLAMQSVNEIRSTIVGAFSIHQTIQHVFNKDSSLGHFVF